MTSSVRDLVAYIDEYLGVRRIADDPRALNGLQVEGTRPVRRIAAAVDACQATIDLAVRREADLLLVHHGLFWEGLEPVTGRHAHRLRTLLTHGIGLYSAHLPLDCHPDVGNNPLLAARLGLGGVEPFAEHHGTAIGVCGCLDADLESLVQRVSETLGGTPRVVAAGPSRVRRVGVVTGAGTSFIQAACDAGLDTLVTGEGPHHSFFDAEEWGVNLVLAGHYATETLGVQALADHLAGRFGLGWEFLDHPTGM